MEEMNVTDSDWVALYQPVKAIGEDPSRRGFATKEDAEKYVFTQMCEECRREREAALAGIQPKEEYVDDDGRTVRYVNQPYPACFSEWLILPYAAYETAKDSDELMEAAGFRIIYRRPD